MQISVRLFAPLDIITGCGEPFKVELSDGATGIELAHLLREKFSDIQLVRRAMAAGGVLLLVNQEYTALEAALKEGDTVTIVPRLAGI
jgi:molybdopterin converting factor small subunit